MPHEHDRQAATKRQPDSQPAKSCGPHQSVNEPMPVTSDVQPSFAHTWEPDMDRTRLEINVLVWRCSACGCLQIRNGEKPVAYKPNRPNWSPFRTLPEEPPCEAATETERPASSRPATASAGK